MAKKLQLLRNQTIFENKAAALAGLKAKLVSAEPILAAGEPLIASYNEGEGKVSILLGISYGDGKIYQIFEGAKIGDSGNLEIPKEVQDAIDKAINALDTADTAVTRNFVTSVSQENGKITVQRGAVTSTGATITITDGDDGGINLEVVSSALTQYVGKDAIVVGEDSGGEKEISLKLNAADKVLTQDASGLIANINLTWDKVEGLKLVGKDSAPIATIPSEDFIKDGMLEDVELVQLSGGTGANPSGLTDGTYLKFTFNTDGGSEVIYVNVTSLIDIYTGTNGIQVSGKEISAVKDPSSEEFLEITAAGIKVTGIQAAIDLAKGVEQAAIDKIEASVGLKEDGSYIKPTSGNYTSDSTTVMDAISKLDTQVKANADALSTANDYTVNGYKISTNPVLYGKDITLSGYTRSELTNEALNIAPADTVNVGFGKLEKAILDNEEVCSKAFDEVATAVGLNRVGMTYVVPTGTTYISASTSVQDADIKLDAAIKAVNDTVVAEVGKDYLDGVVAGNGIAVTEKASNKQTISAKAVVSDPIIEVTENGIGTKTDAVWDCGTY